MIPHTGKHISGAVSALREGKQILVLKLKGFKEELDISGDDREAYP